MGPRPPRSTRTDTLFPYPTLFRSRAMERCLVVLLLCCVSAFASAGGGVRVLPQDSGVDVRLRGISAVDADVAWASGAKGTVLRTLDGGRHWRHIVVPGADELDFRDVEGFDARAAVVRSEEHT